MDAEFLNAYIAKLRAMVDEFVNKTVILETHLSLSQAKLEALQKELEELKVTKKVKTKEDTF